MFDYRRVISLMGRQCNLTIIIVKEMDSNLNVMASDNYIICHYYWLYNGTITGILYLYICICTQTQIYIYICIHMYSIYIYIFIFIYLLIYLFIWIDHPLSSCRIPGTQMLSTTTVVPWRASSELWDPNMATLGAMGSPGIRQVPKRPVRQTIHWDFWWDSG